VQTDATRTCELPSEGAATDWCTTPTASPQALVPGGRLRPHAGELERRPCPLPQ
jgi:hypothetical protein